MLNNRFAITLLILLLFSAVVFSQSFIENSENQYRIVFYNVENFFDVLPDSTIDYNEFIPDADRRWNYSRYKTKQTQIFKVITAIGEWKSPAVVAFAEIENRFVLDDLLNNTPLWNDHYQVVHFESIDHRGIDVGLIYNEKQVKLIDAKPIRYRNTDGKALATRDILYAKFLLSDDTLHLIVNHWSSRYGGTLQSAPLRRLAASVLRKKVDSICDAVHQPKILIMGDFNDDPEDESIRILTAENQQCQLRNLELVPTDFPVKGTLKYQAEWNSFDQIIVTDFLLQNSEDFHVSKGKASVFSPAFLLEEDEKHLGMKPKRTYIGFKYHGGFSDHLPVYVDIYMAKRQ